jgi:hypothetical protein
MKTTEEKVEKVGGNNDSSRKAVSLHVADDYYNVNDDVIAVTDADSRTIAEVLNEVNEFIDSLDDNKDWGKDSLGPVGVGNERTDVGEDDAVNASEELFSSLGGRYGMTSETQREIEDNAVNKRGYSHRGNMAVGDDGDSKDQCFSSSLGNRDQGGPEGTKASNNEVSDGAKQTDSELSKELLIGSLSGYRNYGRDKDMDVFELTRASEDMFNKITHSYNVSKRKSNETTDNILENSTAESANSGGGSSVENMPPSSQHLQIRSSHQLRSRKQQQQQPRSSQKKILGQDQVASSINSRVHQISGISPEQSNAIAKTIEGSSKTDDPARPVSPFSAKARQIMARCGSTINSVQGTESTSDRIKFDLQNCRRVSLLLNVSPHPQTMTEEEDEAEEDDEVDEDGYGPILFPALGVGGDEHAVAVADEVDTVSSTQSQLRRGEVILVNPHAFDTSGKEGDDSEGLRKNNDSIIMSVADKSKERLSGRVTVETARLVAEVVSGRCWGCVLFTLHIA